MPCWPHRRCLQPRWHAPKRRKIDCEKYRAQIERRKRILALGDRAYQQSVVVASARKKVELLAAQLAGIIQDGNRTCGLSRWGRGIKASEMDDWKGRLKSAENAVRLAKESLAQEEAKLVELQRLAHQTEHLQ